MRYEFENDGNITGLSLFQYVGNGTEITVPENVTALQQYAFQNCSSLTKVTLPDGVREIPYKAFADCYRLQEVVLPKKLVSIAQNAFENCVTLTNLSLPQELLSIGTNAFYGCENLSDLTVPDSVETIGTTIIGDSQRLHCSIGSSASIALCKSGHIFYAEGFKLRYNFDKLGNLIGLTALAYVQPEASIELRIPHGVTETDSAFVKNSPDFKCLILPEGFISLNCTEITWKSAIVFPKTIQNVNITKELDKQSSTLTIFCYRDTEAESWAMLYDLPIVYLDQLQPEDMSIVLSADHFNITMDQTLSLSQIASVIPFLPDNAELKANSNHPDILRVENDGSIRPVGKGQTTLEIFVSQYPNVSATCTVNVLRVMRLPAGMKEIGECAFLNCSAEAVVLPIGCTRIGLRAFANNPSLLIIDIPSTVKFINANAFTGCPNLTIYTPYNSYASNYARQYGISCIEYTSPNP